MKKNSKISVALHSLIHLIKSVGPQTSDELARCMETNPVVIRRILGELRKNGLVQSEKGHGGGWIMNAASDQISLYDVYKALDESLLPDSPTLEKNEKCVIIKTLVTTMDDFLVEANTILNQRLKNISLKDIADEISSQIP